ncbi:MAG: polyprenol monophosphomannose synthase [bacterium]|nr:polyprenol monophosphomannose synthase [bacterium]
MPTGQANSLPSVTTPSSVLVLLCTYNELGNLPKLFAEIDRYMPAASILVVDDNSPDGTWQWVQQRQTERPATHLLKRSGKLGLGTALRDGIQWCLDRDFDFLVNLDADLSHDPASIPALVKACQGEQVDVAVGTRYLEGGSSPGLAPHRKLISRMLNSYANRMLRLPLTDCSGSFRCYRVSKLRELNLHDLQCPGYGFLEEILVALKKQGATFTEVPITFDCRYAGKSKLSWKDALGALQVIHRLAFGKTKN